MARDGGKEPPSRAAFLSQAEETEHRDNHDHETDDINNAVHTEPPCFGEMPLRQGMKP
jgi:hypothetical protein